VLSYVIFITSQSHDSSFLTSDITFDVKNQNPWIIWKRYFLENLSRIFNGRAVERLQLENCMK